MAELIQLSEDEFTYLSKDVLHNDTLHHAKVYMEYTDTIKSNMNQNHLTSRWFPSAYCYSNSGTNDAAAAKATITVTNNNNNVPPPSLEELCCGVVGGVSTGSNTTVIRSQSPPTTTRKWSELF